MQRHLSIGSRVRIVWQIGWSDFLLKYRGSLLGYLWSFADPLLRFAVIFVVFRPFVGVTITEYPLYLFLGIIVWDTFVRTVTGCITMLTDKAAIIQKIPFQKELLIYAVGWTNTIIFATHLCIFALFAVFRGVDFTMYILVVPLLVFLLQALGMAVGMFLSAFSLKFKDIPHLWQVLHQILFWLTPVFYPYTMTESILENTAVSGVQLITAFIRFQPVSVLLTALRSVTLYPTESVPSALNYLGLLAGIGIVFFVALFIFRARSRYFIQEY